MPETKEKKADAADARCITGIDGLDRILNGGIPRGNTVLITGSCGTGKTTLSLEFLLHGALNNENSLFISVTENWQKLIKNVIPYRFFDEDLLKNKKLIMIDLGAIYNKLGLEKSEFTAEDIDIIVRAVGDIVKEWEIKRLVIDSITSICFQLKTKEKIRDFILYIGKNLSEAGCTSILVSEISRAEQSYSMYGVEEAIADGIVLMANMERRGDLLRTLQVVKMRGTMHSRAKYVLDLTPEGVLLVPLLKGGSIPGGI
ncbi:MAG: circadian clock protein KaiC [Candidatus Altiarchaeales archaeon WOR_SM1_79]|nr:MAG: circadian clock protein KaiC [Candidatus Altiarchaeales archaeon WOR_SM1_79]